MDKKIRSATEEWVKTFNVIPTGAIRKIEETLKPLGEKSISHVPMWEYMWTFSSIHDQRWLENGGLEKMINCGLCVFEQEDFGYIFGIDGCGYDFYEDHWIPLYKERGLSWHQNHSNEEKQVRKKFNLNKTIKNLKKEIFCSRKNNYITKEEARNLYEYLSEKVIRENIETFRRFSQHNLSYEEEQEKALLISLNGWSFWDDHFVFTLNFFVYE